MADTGALLPGTGAEDSSAGFIGWTSPSYITDAVNEAESETGAPGGYETYYLVAKDFDFSGIPDGSTVDGIKVEVKRRRGDVSTYEDVIDAEVTIIAAGNVDGDNKADLVTTWPVAPAAPVKEYGGAADLWNVTTWTDGADALQYIKDTETYGDFGVGLRATIWGGGVGETGYAYVNYIKMTVYYTAPAGESASQSPSESPSDSPSLSPSPSESVSPSPSVSPSTSPSDSPSESPSDSPSESPSESPSTSPSLSPSTSESTSPSPSTSPSTSESTSPSESPSSSPSTSESVSPSVSPSTSESESPSMSPSYSLPPRMAAQIIIMICE